MSAVETLERPGVEIDPPAGDVDLTKDPLREMGLGDEFPDSVVIVKFYTGKHMCHSFDTKGFEPDPMLDKKGLGCHATEDSAITCINETPFQGSKGIPGFYYELVTVTLDEARELAKEKNLCALLLFKGSKIKKVMYL